METLTNFFKLIGGAILFLIAMAGMTLVALVVFVLWLFGGNIEIKEGAKKTGFVRWFKYYPI